MKKVKKIIGIGILVSIIVFMLTMYVISWFKEPIFNLCVVGVAIFFYFIVTTAVKWIDS